MSILLTNGRIYRSAKDENPAQALLIEAGLVSWLGAAADAPEADEIIDLEGRSVLPGLTDAHLHVFALALARLQVSFARTPARDFSDIIRLLKDRQAETPPGDWVHASDLIEDLLAERRLPTRSDLDTEFPETPVLLRRYCGHVAVMNSAAIRALDLPEDVTDPEAGVFLRDADGRLTGIAEETAAEWVFARAPVASQTDLMREIRATWEECLSYGLTSLTEAAVGFSIGYDREAAIWAQLRAAGDLPVRHGFMLQLTPEDARERGLTPEFGEAWSGETLKFFADGIVGGRSGAVSEPYEDTGGTGVLMQPPGVLEDHLKTTHADGWRIAVHATGDRGVSRVLAAMEAAQGTDTSRRHRIEHVFVPPQGVFLRMAQANVLTVTQPSFLVRMGASAIRGLGRRADTAYPAASALAADAPLVFSSDAPTGFLSPWIGVSAAVTRRGSHEGQLGAGEALSVRDALDAYISGGAYAMRHEGFRGQLTPGFAADLAVFGADPFETDADALADMKADLTIMGGRVVYRGPDAPAT
ncbi:MAG: amidohydrolase [Pseudomonadota bacterium]|nr:amidohydrolase [Pseudomonadota bacterium]